MGTDTAEGADVIRLAPAPDSPQGFRADVVAEVVDCLRDLLERAEAGEIVGVVVAFVKGSGDFASRFTSTENTAGMLAALSMAAYRYQRHLHEEASTDEPEPKED